MAFDLASSQARGENLVETKADIVIEFLDGSKVVLDTKYKMLKENEKDLGVSNADIYQMLVYHRVHTIESPPRLVLLYPKNINDQRVRLDIRGGGVAVGIFTLNLHRSLSKERGVVIYGRLYGTK
jgi:5-methylcytosine-specific restriction enzyme subunit McrC